MQLPKISYPTITINIPPSNKPFSFRPMLVKEEKLLLMAKVSEDETDILQTIKQVVNNCCLDPTLNIEQLPLYALEYAFIKLRGFSIGDEIKVSYRDFDDDKIYDFIINLNQVKIKTPDILSDNKIAITPKSGIVLKVPQASLYDDKKFLQTEGDDAFYHLIIKCIDQVYDGDSVYNGQDFKEEDLIEFIELVDIKTFDKIRQFMNNLPTLYYKIEYKNSIGNDKIIELKSLSDFFTLR